MNNHEEHTGRTLLDQVARFSAYPFDTDETFQQGLAGILNSAGLSDKPGSERDDVELRSRVFYFNRLTGLNVTVDEVRLHDSTSDHSPAEAGGSFQSTTQSDGESAEHILSFAELKELIEQGKTDGIPHNRIIPDDLNTEKPSESKAAIRRKPWEIIDQEVAANEQP